MRELHQRLLKIHGKPYGVYKSLQGQFFNFGDFTLKFTHIQGDPHAQPSRIMLSAKMSSLGFPEELHSDKEKEIALADFLLRQFTENADNISIVRAHSQIMQRNSLCIEKGIVRILASVNLPGDGRRIEGDKASELLIGTLSDWVTRAMYWNNSDKEKCKVHVQCLINRNFLLSQLAEKKIAAFVPNGAILPRESGVSEEPMLNAVPFISPPELLVHLSLPSGEQVAGMGIPHGITVIAGGGFHGKSTLLHALEEAVYPHIPGDGREFIVIDESATPIKTEEGRVVTGTNISPLVRELPLKGITEKFTTKNASGATSQAANLIEALELGASTILIDEDASAVNFLIRDLRMRELINSKREPLIPLTDRIREFADKAVNFIIVAGACGDYLSLADTVIAFVEYKAECLTERAKNTQSGSNSSKRGELELPPLGNFKESRLAKVENLQEGLKPNSAVEKSIKIKAVAGQISIGKLKSDLRRFPAFCHTELQRGIAEILHNFVKEKENEGKSLRDALKLLCEKLPENETCDLALPRVMELGATFLRFY
ncbi:MAG: ABC-ATPase domain-containing protein [Candidatus Fibromonas sp.]|jgi:predicted ABC-class ATPase|nr:ABC-ATPase domain-containing protein [Candidatus Fibromonas sp.]